MRCPRKSRSLSIFFRPPACSGFPTAACWCRIGGMAASAAGATRRCAIRRHAQKPQQLPCGKLFCASPGWSPQPVQSLWPPARAKAPKVPGATEHRKVCRVLWPWTSLSRAGLGEANTGAARRRCSSLVEAGARELTAGLWSNHSPRVFGPPISAAQSALRLWSPRRVLDPRRLPPPVGDRPWDRYPGWKWQSVRRGGSAAMCAGISPCRPSGTGGV